jgi:hypothetical protein
LNEYRASTYDMLLFAVPDMLIGNCFQCCEALD